MISLSKCASESDRLAVYSRMFWATVLVLLSCGIGCGPRQAASGVIPDKGALVPNVNNDIDSGDPRQPHIVFLSPNGAATYDGSSSKFATVVHTMGYSANQTSAAMFRVITGVDPKTTPPATTRKLRTSGKKVTAAAEGTVYTFKLEGTDNTKDSFVVVEVTTGKVVLTHESKTGWSQPVLAGKKARVYELLDATGDVKFDIVNSGQQFP